MEFLAVILIAGVVFGLCWLIDKAFNKLFRSKAQHFSGKSVHLNKRYATAGVLLAVLGIGAMVASAGNNLLLWGGVLLLVTAAGLIAYYLGTGIFYDDDTFLQTSFGKKNATYRYRDIVHQQLYVVTGGGFIVELHMKDGTAVQLQSQMVGAEAFLSHAFTNWCRQRGINPEDCDFYHPENRCWFPDKEEA